jgi:hypothetical protein
MAKVEQRIVEVARVASERGDAESGDAPQPSPSVPAHGGQLDLIDR